MTREFIAQVLPALVSMVLLPLVGAVVQRLLRKYNIEAQQGALGTLGTIAQVLVGRAAQTIVADLKDPSRPGTWTEAAAETTKRAVLAQMKVLGRTSIETLRGQGHTDAELGSLLDALLEAAVRRDKALGSPSSAAPGSVPTAAGGDA